MRKYSDTPPHFIYRNEQANKRDPEKRDCRNNWSERLCEISSQVSQQFEELKSDLNTQSLEVINSDIAEKVLPSIENAIRPTKTGLNTKWDLRSDGLHQSEFAQAIQNRDFRSDGLHQCEFAQTT